MQNTIKKSLKRLILFVLLLKHSYGVEKIELEANEYPFYIKPIKSQELAYTTASWIGIKRSLIGDFPGKKTLFTIQDSE